ncbi:hypothetical protein HHK36_017022 [Tetracentron sinense]|uniref:Uncharacterized protein n=1 Tax=Tetracentron sinense TaxID=13715 RepID=A0A834Z3T8_TETSI|nr:hypothetical protein HHK36_017022 [Tetracentron sinense]
MGLSSSRIEEDKPLQLCRERKRFVRQALDGRCSLAAAHVTYIQSLKNTGAALRKFVEPEVAIESSLYTSTSETHEPLALTEKSLSQFSFSSPSLSQRVDGGENLSPYPSPPYSGRFQANYMKTGGSSSTKIEEKPPFPVIGTLRSSSSTPQNLTPRSTERPETTAFEAPSLPNGTPPWDYFGLFHPIDDQFSFQDGRGLNHGLENADDIRRLREEEGIPELEDEEEKVGLTGTVESEESEDEFDEPSTNNLVRSFENHNRVLDSYSASVSPTMPSARSIASKTEVLNGGIRNSPDLKPLKTTSSVVTLPTDVKKTAVKEAVIENKLASKDFLSSIKEIDYLFLKASESGKEVPRMLEANKFHFRPIFPGKDGGSMASIFFKACFSCGDDPTQVPEEPVQTAIKYLTWHRTTSSRSSSSRNPLGTSSKGDNEDISLFENFCMNSGSHASTLDRLYAWERKLYDEVKTNSLEEHSAVDTPLAGDEGLIVTMMQQELEKYIMWLGHLVSVSILDAKIICAKEGAGGSGDPVDPAARSWCKGNDGSGKESVFLYVSLLPKYPTSSLLLLDSQDSSLEAKTKRRTFVKASGIIRREYDMKCKLLRQQDSRAEGLQKIDKTRAVVKDLHSRIGVAIHRINTISKRIEEIRDKELQPQLEELIEGLSRMWEKMFECHKLQFSIISVAYNNGNTKMFIQSESHRQATIHLEYELSTLSSSFTKWISAQKSYLEAIDRWLMKCITLQQKQAKKRKHMEASSVRKHGPFIFLICDDWLKKLKDLPTKEVAESIKLLAVNTTHLLPRQEKNQGKSSKQLFSSPWKTDNNSEAAAAAPRDEILENWTSGFDHFRSSLVGFLDRLKGFAESSMKMYGELENDIKKSKSSYDQSTQNPRSEYS